MKLHFPWKEIEKALYEVETGEELRKSDFLPAEKGLWLVGDRGVYIMPNTTDGQYNCRRDKPLVVYARECNPETMDFEVWHENKRISFGGDDGAEFIKVEEIRELAARSPNLGCVIPAYLIIDITPQQFACRIAWQASRAV